MADVRTYLDGQDHGVGSFVDYAGTYDVARGIHDAIDLVEDLLRDGQPAVVIELSEHSLRRVEQVLESVDDSDGGMGGLLERIQELHLVACRAARPDPDALAARLFAWDLGDEWDVVSGAPETYAGVLGADALATYRRPAEAEWAKVPALGPGSGEGRPHSSRRYRVTSIMESLARAAGDVDDLVAVKSRDLSVAYRFLEIAQVCLDAGREDEALDWAERGVRAFPTGTDGRLRAFLAELYHRRFRHNEAMALIWAELVEQPVLEHPVLERCQLLKAHADRVDAWPAWQEAAALGRSDALWRELAVKRESDHPADSLPNYQREVNTLLDTKRNDGYEAAVKLLERIRALMIRLDRQHDFAPYLASARTAHGRKRNFTKLLDDARW